MRVAVLDSEFSLGLQPLKKNSRIVDSPRIRTRGLSSLSFTINYLPIFFQFCALLSELIPASLNNLHSSIHVKVFLVFNTVMSKEMCAETEETVEYLAYNVIYSNGFV